MLASPRGLCGMRTRKTRRRGCGTQDHHKQWLNTDCGGMTTGAMTWLIALSGAYGVFVRGGG